MDRRCFGVDEDPLEQAAIESAAIHALARRRNFTAKTIRGFRLKAETTMKEMVTLDDVRAAAVRIRGVAVRTPLIEAGPLALKCENLQPMGAFKVRGACNMIAQLPPEARAAGVITYSSGNHGQAVALVAQRFGIPAVVVMPETAPPVKVEGVRRYGAEVIFAGTTTLHRKARAEAEAARR